MSPTESRRRVLTLGLALSLAFGGAPLGATDVRIPAVWGRGSDGGLA